MDVELPGGSLLSSFLSRLVDGIAFVELVDFIRRQKNTTGLLKKLKIRLLAVNGVVDDAEERQIRSPAVREWLDELTDTLCHAEDLLDEIQTEDLRRKLEGGLSGESSTTTFFKSSSLVLSEFERTTDLKLVEIVYRLDLIVDQMAALALKIRGVKDRPRARLSTVPRVEEESDIYGRDEDKETIISLLLSGDETYGRIGVIPIVGMGGIGKTTLVKHVFNDARVKEEFDLQGWVYVSYDFDIVRITESIGDCQSIRSRTFFSRDPEHLLKNALAGKKFLIVLDDVWSTNYASWDFLRGQFQSGARGSKIIVTTRDLSVASMMSSLPAHLLSQLSEHDCWELFAKHAFENANGGEHPRLEVIGREIARKCQGLPLAAKSLGGLLRSELDLKQWEMILNSDIWNPPGDWIGLPALWLSYCYLPSHLKRCLAYCSIFPRGYQFTKSELVSLWMAEDLLPPSKRKTMEQVGDDYFHILISRSFFQHSGAYTQSVFTVHDLISDLAKFISGEFCVSLDGGDVSLTMVRKTRHFSYMKSHVTVEKLEGLHNARYLRTFLSIPPPQNSGTSDFRMSNKVLGNLSRTLQCLRVLDLSGYDIIALPDAVSSLKHLRQLVLSGSSIQKLPNSICTLYNLQTLSLSDCTELVELPTNLGSLINLRHLDIKGTRLEKMPPSMGKLKNLQLLTDFVLDKHSGDSIAELSELQHLHGSLLISGLDHNVDDVAALKANLRGKEYLNELRLLWKKYEPRGHVTKDSQKDREVLGQLQPHANLRELVIKSFGGSSFPDWLGDPYLSKLSSIELEDCKHCSFLPPLGKLPSLAKLSIKGFNELLSIGFELCGPFRSLKELSFIGMLKWQEWSYVDGCHEEGGVFPNLCKLTLGDCPYLTNILPLDSFPKLEDVRLFGLRSFAGSLSQESQCPTFLSLRRLSIDKCPKLVCLSDGGMDAPNLKEMRILWCGEFRSLPKQMHTLLPSLEHLQIEGCLDSFPEEGLPPALKSLEFHCNNGLFKNHQHWGLQRVSSLRDLRIWFWGGEEVCSFPERLLPTSLTSLSISNLPNVTTLEKLSCVNSLQSLYISCMPKLRSLPEEMLASSLSQLVITNCPLLQERVQKERGEAWSKIADIPCIEIDGEEI
ncbi:putative P-loop containing nucleoside triphosphate hydrolase, leucine-rich repeat domain, L [Rosa chinensis]|uniref:Putative P-loop containing nucleoside triphosphate hydrolase, leucine-rich repeat domain, L n=1 Tax=Rosa chinensis TaxID=74649 RepID=A0A2P6S8D7_ROSCH|nr:putative disease resistance RPP13-like protein 1 [Rosa chinensis]XP_024175849.1 putative disease resistance RPP13-like protein 1 [Rosa chinensis]PRQ54915.1 putative P-loop containing nucleoside triphosphate hydrolase, leucine-rich repeat domain, L [Rosa chinensis]